jgi:uncharacterized protein
MPQTPLALFLSMACGRFSVRDHLDERKNRIKFFLRSLPILPLMLRWLKTFLAEPELLVYLRHNPRMAAKLHRPYLWQGLRCRAKLAILEAHYRLERTRFPAHIRLALLRGSDLLLATATGRDGSAYRIVLTHSHSFDKEGELSMQLRNSTDITLVTLTFSLSEDQEGPMLIVGGLQGPHRSEGDAGTIRTATKSLNGLFPKRIILEALTALAHTLGIEHIVAVGKSRHIYNALRYRRHFQADYDDFWLSLGAEAVQSGRFRLPATLPRKDIADVASKKRAEYLRRYLLLDSIDAQVAATLDPTDPTILAEVPETPASGSNSALTAR